MERCVKVLVTGSAGFLGRHFCNDLREAGHEVLGIDVRSASPCDARDLFDAPDEFTFDLVLHCAAVVNGRETIERRPMDQVIDLELDAGLFRWALDNTIGRVVYFSSSAAYPISLQQEPYRLREDDIELAQPEMPDALYGWTKLTGELLVHHARRAGQAVTVVRPFSGYGTDQDDCYPFPAIIERARNHDDPFVVWGPGTQVRDFIHVDDIVGATMALVEAEVDGPVNIGNGRPTSMLTLAAMASHAARHKAEITPMVDQPTGVQYRVADPTLMYEYYEPTVSLEDGIERALRGSS